MLGNIKLGTKLVSSFLIISFIGLSIGVVGAMNTRHLNSYIGRMYYKELLGVAHLKEMKSERLDAGRRWRDALLAKTPEEKRKYADMARKNIALYKEDLNQSSEVFYDEKGKALVQEIYKVTTEWEGLLLQMIDLIVNQNLMEPSPEFTAIRKVQEPIGKVIDAKIAELDALKSSYAENTVKESIQMYSNSLIWMTALISFGFIISVVIGLIFSRYLSKQLGGELTDAINEVKKVSLGDFSSQLNIKTNDKNSLLFTLKVMQETILGFIDAQRVMTKKHQDGFISEKIDYAKFKGAYSEMARDTNELVQCHIDINTQVVEIVTQYAQGNFECDMARLPEEKGKITDAIDAVKAALLEINSEIKMLAVASAQGDFSKRSDASRFNFMFKDMLINLNTLIDTCDTGFNDILRVANALSEGDLTHKITNDYPGTFGQTKDAMNGTVDNLKALVKEIKEASDIIGTAAQEIAMGNNDLSHRTEEQAASLQETATSIQKLTFTVLSNSESTTTANAMTLSSSDIAQKGVQVVNQVVTTMENISESSRKIVDIISVIDGIAFQTNILALNAAVEAARAGEQGRGFAVVATEVRSLAQRAAAAAGEIKHLISDSAETIADGTNLVERAGKTMEEIVSSIDNVSQTINAITNASAEQTAGIQQINLAVQKMDDMTQQNAALVEQAASAAESLEKQTCNLTQTVSNFKISSAF